jgi:hypothetical protein
MTPTQEQLVNLWNTVREQLTQAESPLMTTRQDVTDFAEDCSDMAYDTMFACLDILCDNNGHFFDKA